MRGVTALVAILTLVAPALGQQQTPLLGRGIPPDNGLDVYVSAILDRLISVDDVSYRFEAIFFLLLSWEDTRARSIIENSTQAAQDPSYNSGQGCAFPCTSLFTWQPGDDCCDGPLYLPTFEFVNVRGFSQDRVARYGIQFPGQAEVDSGVPRDTISWWVQCHGDFYSPMLFKAFPFDRQYLTVEVEYVDRTPNRTVHVIASSTSTQLFEPLTGNDISGWEIKGIAIQNFTRVIGDLSSKGVTTSAARDPWPLNPGGRATVPFRTYLWSQGFNIHIEVERISSYYVLIAILPVAINVWLCLLVFSVSPKRLETRLGITVTLFLSLTAIQYVISTGLPDSSTIVPTQQLVIASYVVLAVIAFMSICTYYLATLEKRLDNKQREDAAQRSFKRAWASVIRREADAHRPVGGEISADSRPSQQLRSRQADQSPQHPWQSLQATIAVPATEPATDTSTLAAAGEVRPTTETHNRLADQTLSRDRFTGMGAFAAGPSSRASSCSFSNDGSHRSDCRNGSMRERQLSTSSQAPSQQLQPQQPHQGLSLSPPPPQQQPLHTWPPTSDVEHGAGDIPPPLQHVDRWQDLGAVVQCKGKQPGWLKLQQIKLKAMWLEMKRNPEFSLYFAERVDKFTFWIVLVAYNLTAVIVFWVGASNNTEIIEQ